MRSRSQQRRSRVRPQQLSLERLEPRLVPGFLAPLAYDAGGFTISVAAGDFNGDGNPDLAAASASTNNVSVLLGNGDGSFQNARQLAAGNSPYSIALGDFNGDSVLDLAAANYTVDPNSVSVFLGNGDGSFQPVRHFPAGAGARSVVVADFDGDGNSDLATANSSTNNVSVLLGNGDGSFQSARNFPAGSFPTGVTVEDFNRDTIPDLAATNANSNNLTVLLGNGDGSFRSAGTFPTGPSPNWLVAADFDRDGIADLATANRGTGADLSTVSVLSGNGDGTFRSTADIPVGVAPSTLTVADVNGDAEPDLLVANANSSTVSLLLSGHSGVLQVSPVGVGPY